MAFQIVFFYLAIHIENSSNVFPCLIAHFFLALNTLPLSGCLMVCISINLLKDMLVASVCVCVCRSLSCIQLFATPWTVVHQASLSGGFPRQEYWSGLLFPSPRDLPNPGSEPCIGRPAFYPLCRQILYCLSHQGNLVASKFMHL